MFVVLLVFIVVVVFVVWVINFLLRRFASAVVVFVFQSILHLFDCLFWSTRDTLS